jgi:hypothetical protein
MRTRHTGSPQEFRGLLDSCVGITMPTNIVTIGRSLFRGMPTTAVMNEDRIGACEHIVRVDAFAVVAVAWPVLR